MKTLYNHGLKQWVVTFLGKTKNISIHLNENKFQQTPGDSEGKIGTPGMLQSMRSQKLGHDLATEQQAI